jgi:tetratricopeptide (TPR) repeat protein
VLDVAGLDLPVNGNGGSADGAVRLFVERARQIEPDFEPGGDDQEHIARICRLVSGMPLGIELAAAWVAMFPCAEIADEIETTIGFLETSMRDVPERHRSLRAAFDHSWRLLTDDERRSFCQLSVFQGAFTREAASTVAGANLGLLAKLVSKSLVRRLDLGRYELHELLRQYAAERLAEQPVKTGEARERHASFYFGRLADRREALYGALMRDARDELRGDVANLRGAAEWAVSAWPEDEARSALSGLYAFFNVHSWPEGLETFEHLARTLAHSREPTFDATQAPTVLLAVLANRIGFKAALGYDETEDALGRAILPELRERRLTDELGACLMALGTNACYIDAYEDAAPILAEAAAVSHAAGDTWTECASLSWLGFVRLLEDELAAARTAFEESYAIARERDHPQLLAFALSKLGLLSDGEGEYAEAIRHHLEANACFETLGDRGGSGYTLSRASVSAYCLGEYEEALRLGCAGYDSFADVNHRWGMIGAASRVGFALVALGDLDSARERFRWSLEQARATEAKSLALLALSGVGVLLSRDGDKRRAAELLSFVFACPGFPPFYFITSKPELERLEVELSAEELAAARDAAAAADFETVVAMAEDALGDRRGTGIAATAASSRPD